MSKLVNHQRNDDAVSPVIGVMLMIVVTVVIAAVVALFATNVVTSTEAAPVVVMDMNAYSGSSDANSKLVMSTRGGDPLDLTKLKVVVSDSTGEYGLSFVGLDQKGVGDHLEIGEKLTVFTLANIETAASSASGGDIRDVAKRISGEFIVGNKIHVMVTFNENAVIYEKDIIIKAGAETETAEVTKVLDSTSGTWYYSDETPVSSDPFTITYGTTEVSLPVTNNTGVTKGIRFSKGLEGSKVENDSCSVEMVVDDTNYEFQVNGKTLTSTTVLQKGDVISLVKKTQPITGCMVTLETPTGGEWNRETVILKPGTSIRLMKTRESGVYDLVNATALMAEPLAILTLDSGKAVISASFTPESETPVEVEDILNNSVEVTQDGTVEVTTAQVCTVTYDKNGGTGTMTDSSSPYVSGSTVTVLANSFTAPDGKDFYGWNTAADGTGTAYNAGDTISNISQDVKLYAQWGYRLTFSKDNGSTASDVISWTIGGSVIPDEGIVVKPGTTITGSMHEAGNYIDYVMVEVMKDSTTINRIIGLLNPLGQTGQSTTFMLGETNILNTKVDTVSGQVAVTYTPAS